MAIAIDKGLGLDKNKILSRTMAILEDRETYFMDIINTMKKRYPGLKIIYANCTTGEKLDIDHPNPDFILIMRTQMISKDPRMNGRMMTIIEAPPLFTERTIAGWTLAVEDNNIDGYFEYMLDKAIHLTWDKFEEYIVHMCLMSLEPDNELYWKSSENAEKLYKEIMELYGRYSQPSDTTKMNAVKDYSRDAVQRRKTMLAYSEKK